MENYEIVDVRVYDPTKALFKENRKDRSSCTIKWCSSKDTCSLYNKGRCVMKNMFTCMCPYGKSTSESGPTSRARAFYSWLAEHKQKYSDYLDKLKGTEDMIAKVGEYYYLPYAHMNLNSGAPFLSSSGFMHSGTPFIHEKAFTAHVVCLLIKQRPQALFGGEITSYQKEVVPKFVQHIRELFPELYNEVSKETDLTRYVVSYVGRKALLSSLEPGTEIKDGKGAKYTWIWDGEYLTSHDAFLGFMPVKFSEQTVKLKPLPNEVVIISNENQVTSKTIFIS